MKDTMTRDSRVPLITLALCLSLAGCSGEGVVETFEDDAETAPYATDRQPITGDVSIGAELEVMFPAPLRAEPKRNGTVLASLPAEAIVTAALVSPRGGYYQVK